MSKAFSYFEGEYSIGGFNAQRRYPNEELCRFMGRNFFGIPKKERGDVHIVDVGCGSGANLWMIAREGFRATGLDLSPSAIELCQKMLINYNCDAELHVADMCDLPLADNCADAVIDVFSSHCLNQSQGYVFLASVNRVLKRGGRFFSYFPSTRSDTWTNQNHPDADFPNTVDNDTLNGLHRENGPYFGNNHPFRFLHPQKYTTLLGNSGFDVNYCETLTRTYRDRKEAFEFVVIEAIKK